jgi:hypothetical protein
MRRRDFITLLGGAAATRPLAVHAQQRGPMRRIGVLMGYAENDLEAQTQFATFLGEFQKLGWTEGRNTLIDVRWSIPAQRELMQALAKELVALKPDVILSSTTQATTVRNNGATMTFTPKGLSVRVRSRSSRLASEAAVDPGWAVPSIPRPPASDTAATSSGGETAPIPACWIGIVQPTNSVNLVVIMLYVSPQRAG